MPVGGDHGRFPPPPPPHTNNGRMCRLGQVVAALVLACFVATVVGIVTA